MTCAQSLAWGNLRCWQSDNTLVHSCITLRLLMALSQSSFSAQLRVEKCLPSMLKQLQSMPWRTSCMLNLQPFRQGDTSTCSDL
eukprot:526543-Amphidinium_carterae.1